MATRAVVSGGGRVWSALGASAAPSRGRMAMMLYGTTAATGRMFASGGAAEMSTLASVVPGVCGWNATVGAKAAGMRTWNRSLGSAAEAKDEAGHSVFGGVSQTVGELIGSKESAIRTCTEDQFVIDAVKTMVANNIGSLIVMRDDKPVGIVTERDYLEKVIVLGRHSSDTTVKEIMSTKGLISVEPSAKLNTCMDLMASKHVTHIPVIEDDKVRGLVSIGDVVRGLVKSYHEQAEAMNEYIAGSY